MDYPEYTECEYCNGNGTILVCPDDMCRGAGYCMHGDGERYCEACDGTGEIELTQTNEDKG